MNDKSNKKKKKKSNVQNNCVLGRISKHFDITTTGPQRFGLNFIYVFNDTSYCKNIEKFLEV